MRTEKLYVVSLPAPSRPCWPGHLDMRQIRRNRQEATWPVFTDTWITFCCCQPGTVFSNSFHPLRRWFSLPNCPVALCHLHSTQSASVVTFRAPSTYSPNTYRAPTLSLCWACLRGCSDAQRDVVPSTHSLKSRGQDK